MIKMALTYWFSFYVTPRISSFTHVIVLESDNIKALNPRIHCSTRSKIMGYSGKTSHHAVILFCYRLGKSLLETLGMMEKASGKHCVSRYSVYRWFSEVNDSLHDEKRSGRPLSSRTNAGRSAGRS